MQLSISMAVALNLTSKDKQSRILSSLIHLASATLAFGKLFLLPSPQLTFTSDLSFILGTHPTDVLYITTSVALIFIKFSLFILIFVLN
ncbi:MAG: hypothetical protein LBU32_23475 [Clostridiales bacterium]|jgi:hypothetical protein|nr:hypothetical protein [Clostridiales bacterium]